MPKPVKKASGKLPVPPKSKRPSDPNRAAKAILDEHMARLTDGQDVTPPRGDTFQEQLSAHMARLGAKGGKISGAKRMEMPEKQRKAIAKKAAAARWGKKD
jgi:hypothetical protein